MSRLVIGVGSRWRSDDGAGLAAARRLREAASEGLRILEHEGDLAALIDAWQAGDDVAIVDAAASGAAPGTIHRYDIVATGLPARLCRSSTHAFGVAEAIELARALERLPASLTVYAIEGQSFSAGERLTPAVEEAVEQVVAELSGRGNPALQPGPTLAPARTQCR